MSSYSCFSDLTKKSKYIGFLSGILKLVSEENRLKLLCLLRQKELCVCELKEQVNMSQSLISHHLSNLKKAGIAIDDKRGLRVYYSLTEKGKYITNLLFSILKKEVGSK